ncbi:MAG: M1 family aminopeptidase [Candidatus Zixiibacteriota bacterium]
MFCRIAAFVVLTSFSCSTLAKEPTITPVKFHNHDLQVALQVPTHSANIEDAGSFTIYSGWNLFYLNRTADMKTFEVNGKPMSFRLVSLSDTAQLPDNLRTGLPPLEVEREVKLVLFESRRADSTSFALKFQSVFDDPVENVQFSREKVGNEVAGTILDQGSYLSSAAFYYPQGQEKFAKFRLTADIPAAWVSVADGNPVSEGILGDRKIQTWENPFRSDGCVFMAAPYAVRTTTVDSIIVATYFFVADTGLCDKYLKASADYIRMYQELIGPYPFRQFTVAENFFPTGYGMPGWTLLGQSVLRLPFIITSSLGHEVLHNWWGNSVYVDYERGNWCEAVTVYGADYRYKLNESPDAAKEYRKGILKEYLSYVNSGNDFPIRNFKSRTSVETRTIGYNKAMMVFHMIEERIGTKAFFDAWKLVYKEHLGRAISWEEWIDAFQRTSGQDLSYIIPQWIDQTGAPFLAVQDVTSGPGTVQGTRTIHATLTQSGGTPYTLRVPVRIGGAATAIDTTVTMLSPSTVVELTVPESATSLTVDPDNHLFRRLYPEEVEPIISAVLGAPQKGLVSFASDELAGAAFAAFGSALLEDTAKVLSASALDGLSKETAPILLNPSTLPDYISRQVTNRADSVTVAGVSYALVGHTFVLAGQNWNGFAKYLVILTGDYGSLPRLGQLVPHYGKYSYLVFEGAKNVGKGQWSVTESPLRVVLSK